MQFDPSNTSIWLDASGLLISELLSLMHEIQIDSSIKESVLAYSNASAVLQIDSKVENIVFALAKATNANIQIAQSVTDTILNCISAKCQINLASSARYIVAIALSASETVAFDSLCSETVGHLVSASNGVKVECTASKDLIEVYLTEHNLPVAIDTSCNCLIYVKEQVSNSYSISSTVSEKVLLYRPLLDITSTNLGNWADKAMYDWFYKTI